MLPPRAWEAFERMGTDVSASSPCLWKKKVCWCLAFEVLGLYPQTQGQSGTASVQEGGPVAASSRLTSEVKFLRVSLGVSQPLQGLTWAGTGSRALAAGREERGACKLQPETLPGGSRGKNKVDCTWCPCSAALQSTEGNFMCLMAKCKFILQVCAFPCIRPLGGERYPWSPNPPRGYPPTTRAKMQQRWHRCILPAKAPVSPQHAELLLLLQHPSPAFHAGLVITACANLPGAWLIFYPLTCLSTSKQIQRLQSQREDWRWLYIPWASHLPRRC